MSPPLTPRTITPLNFLPLLRLPFLKFISSLRISCIVFWSIHLLPPRSTNTQAHLLALTGEASFRGRWQHRPVTGHGSENKGRWSAQLQMGYHVILRNFSDDLLCSIACSVRHVLEAVISEWWPWQKGGQSSPWLSSARHPCESHSSYLIFRHLRLEKSVLSEIAQHLRESTSPKSLLLMTVWLAVRKVSIVYQSEFPFILRLLVEKLKKGINGSGFIAIRTQAFIYTG